MGYQSDASYRKYCQYRVNRHRYKVDQIAAPIAMMIIIGLVTKFWWLITGFILYALITWIIKVVKQHNYYIEETQLQTKKNLSVNSDKRLAERRLTMDMKSTEAGYVNKNSQKNLGKTNKPGTDNNQWFYQMECQECGHQYYANGSDIWLRKCPHCQGGKS